MPGLLERIKVVWQSLSPWGRALLLAAAAVGTVAITIGIYWAARPDYRLLFGGLTPEAAAAVTSALDRQGVPYKLSSDGTSVYVPSSQVTRLRVSLAAEGVGGGSGKGFELFDEAPFGLTPFLEQVNYLRALQAELARTITELEPVAAARVHISRGESSPFVREQKPPTASVVVKLRPGATLPPSTVRGIVALVAGSVDGLEPANVSLLDSTGRVLFGGQDETSLVPTTILDYKKSLEEYLSARAEEMLAHLLGPGRAVVRVSAEVDVTEQEQVQERYDPEGKVIRTEQITTRKETGGQSVGGVPGVASNVPGVSAPRTGTTGSGSTSQEEVITSEYEISRTTTTVRDHVGEIQRLTVAVLVDLPQEGSQGAGGAGGQQGSSATVTVKDVEEVVKNAVGFQEGRDSITVSATRLASAAMQEQMRAELAEAQKWDRYVAIAKAVSTALVVAVVLLLGWSVLRRLIPASSKPATDERTAPQSEPTEQEQPQTLVISDLSERVRRDPEAVARILEQWLREEAAA